MIQRIQTIFMSIVLCLWGIMQFLNLCSLFKGYDICTMNVWSIKGAKDSISTWPIGVISVCCILLSIGAILAYKNRILQIRLNIGSILLCIGFYILVAFYILLLKNKIGDDLQITFHISLIIPFVNMVLSYLAIRYIGKDEALIRSLDHLR